MWECQISINMQRGAYIPLILSFTNLILFLFALRGTINPLVDDLVALFDSFADGLNFVLKEFATNCLTGHVLIFGLMSLTLAQLLD